MSDNLKNKANETPVGITGHVWDGDLCEYNNPLPRWWLLSFYMTVIFCIGYWFLFPTWPLPNSYTKGLYKVTVQEKKVDQDGNYIMDADGQYESIEKSVNWNTRTRFTNELQTSREAMLRRDNFAELMAMNPDDILDDGKMVEFAMKAAKVAFADNCATCHGPNASGHVGFYPNLTDDTWLWGGDIKTIEQTIAKGRRGNMTAGSLTMSEDEINDVSKYVLTLSEDYSGNKHWIPDAATARGEELFYGKGTCYTCHTQIDPKDPMARQPATGNHLNGAPDLTDQTWEIVDVMNMTSADDKLAHIIPHVRDGVNPLTTNRVMPAWEARLTPELIRALAVYVKNGDIGEEGR